MPLIVKKINSLENTDFFQELPIIWKNYLLKLQNKDRKKTLLSLEKIFLNDSIEIAIYVLQNSLNTGYEDPDDFSEVEFSETIGREEIEKLDFIMRQENLIFYGSSRNRKNSFSHRNRCCSLYCRKKSEFRKFMSSLKKYDLLICDEWCYIPLEIKGAELLFQVIADCYERKSLIITTNLEFGKWNSIFLDKKLTAAIVDRIIHHSHLITFTGESYR